MNNVPKKKYVNCTRFNFLVASSSLAGFYFFVGWDIHDLERLAVFIKHDFIRSDLLIDFWNIVDFIFFIGLIVVKIVWCVEVDPIYSTFTF